MEDLAVVIVIVCIVVVVIGGLVVWCRIGVSGLISWVRLRSRDILEKFERW